MLKGRAKGFAVSDMAHFIGSLNLSSFVVWLGFE
jgi:hypothetical protein